MEWISVKDKLPDIDIECLWYQIENGWAVIRSIDKDDVFEQIDKQWF